MSSSIPAGATVVMIAKDIEMYNVETGAFEDLSSPDVVTFRVRNSDGVTVTEVSGNQQGSTNNFNATFVPATQGVYYWQCEVVEGSAVGRNKMQRVDVGESLPDV